MKGRISKRLFLYMLLIVIGFTALILLSNTLLLRPLYDYSVKSTMLGAMNQFAAIDYQQDTDEWLDEVSALNSGKAFDVVVVKDNIIVFSTSSEIGLHRPQMIMGNGQKMKMERYPFNLDRLQQGERFEEVGNNTYIGEYYVPGTEIPLKTCYSKLPDQEVMIILTQPIAPINQSIAQSNILLFACALVALGVFTILALKMSKRFTKPIREIQSTVGEMAALNFDHRCDVKTGDELESLAGDVNQLGDELQRALETLRQQNEQLEKDILAQKQFISNASHELRTPLVLIKGYADEMNTGFAQSQQQQKAYIEIIAQESAKMNRLLKEMLELSRMESGRFEMRNETLSVHEQIRGFIEKYGGYIAENGLNISLRLEGDDMAILDPMRFEQVLANYISNAAKYGNDDKRIEIKAEAKERSIRISVFNSGQHIDEQKMHHLWDGFYKTDDARMGTMEGYGLGLSVVKAIQNVAGQDFGVQNVPGGVVFWFEVARAKK